MQGTQAMNNNNLSKARGMAQGKDRGKQQKTEAGNPIKE
jgi:hypothetical protein